MPRLEAPAGDRSMERDSREAHRIRLRDRIAQFEEKLALLPDAPSKNHPDPAKERVLIRTALDELSEQQRGVEGSFEGPQDTGVVSKLQEEIAGLRRAFADTVLKLQGNASPPSENQGSDGG